MSRLWAESSQRGGALLVLLAIADFANDEGLAHPSVQTLARKSRLSESQVHHILRELQASKELVIERNAGPHRSNIYRVQFPEGAVDNIERVRFPEQRVLPVIAEGATGSTQTVKEPLLGNPSNEPLIEWSASTQFQQGFKALETIPAYKPTSNRDESLVGWLKENEVTGDVFLRSATALAGRWPPKTKHPDPWLQVRTYCLNQKKWDAERLQGNASRTRASPPAPPDLEMKPGVQPSWRTLLDPSDPMYISEQDVKDYEAGLTPTLRRRTPQAPRAG